MSDRVYNILRGRVKNKKSQIEKDLKGKKIPFKQDIGETEYKEVLEMDSIFRDKTIPILEEEY